MRDEDFVMGYVCGYNDGGGSGGGAFDDVVIAHRYRFGDTPYGIGTIDYNLTRHNCYIYNVAQWSVYNDDGSYTTVYGPVDSLNIRYAYALLKNDDIIGFFVSNQSISNWNTNYSYANGVWTKGTEYIDVFGDCTIIANETLRNDVVTQIEYYQQVTMNGKLNKNLIMRRVRTGPDIYAASGLQYVFDMDHDDYTKWVAAFAAYGINLEEVTDQ